MPKFKLTASYQSAVSATLAGDGKAKLKAWAENSSFDRDGRVWLADLPDADVSLLLPEGVIDDPANWQGETFNAPSNLLDIVVTADSAEAVYDVLAKALFRFGGEIACFPVHMTPRSAQFRAGECGPRVLVSQVHVRETRRKRGGFGDAVELEYLSVSVPREIGAKADSWQALPEEARAESAPAAESGAGLALLEQRLSAKASRQDGYGFDPLSIILILAAIIPLVQGCFAATPAALRRRLVNRARLAAAIRRETGVSFSDAFRRADDVLDLANDASDAELESVIADCRGK